MNITNMRKLSLLLLALTLLTGGLKAQQNKKNIIDEVIWIVGDEAILKSDVETMILDAEINRRPIEGNPYCIFPEQIAIEKLYLHQAAIDSITVNSEGKVRRTKLYYLRQLRGKAARIKKKTF